MTGCAVGPLPNIHTTQFVIEGRYRYIDGDRLLWPCRPNGVCTETLVRDSRLQTEVERSPEFQVKLLVERVPACGGRSSEVACVNSLDRTALLIDRWLEVHRYTADRTNVGAPTRIADRPPPPPSSSDDEDRLPNNRVGATHNPNRPDDQNEQPQTD